MRPSRLLALAGLAVLSASASAQSVVRESHGLSAEAIGSTLVYGLIGIVLCVAGYFAFDKIAGLSLRKELAEDQNVAVGIMLAGVFIGLSIVVAAVMLS